ncbi:MAG: hypothetical protein ACE5I1_26635, partial [bacterium]
QRVQPKRDLDYKIIKVDSIPYNNLALQDAKKQAESATQVPAQSAQQSPANNPPQKVASRPMQTTAAAPSRNRVIASKRAAGSSSNMIIVDSSNPCPARTSRAASPACSLYGSS